MATTSSRFLALPTEVRLRVYTFIFAHTIISPGRSQTQAEWAEKYAYHEVKLSAACQILLTCKQCNDEGGAILWANSPLCLTRPRDNDRFTSLSQPRPSSVALIRTLRIAPSHQSYFEEFWPESIKRTLPNLRRIEAVYHWSVKQPSLVEMLDSRGEVEVDTFMEHMRRRAVAVEEDALLREYQTKAGLATSNYFIISGGKSFQTLEVLYEHITGQCHDFSSGTFGTSLEYRELCSG